MEPFLRALGLRLRGTRDSTLEELAESILDANSTWVVDWRAELGEALDEFSSIAAKHGVDSEIDLAEDEAGATVTLHAGGTFRSTDVAYSPSANERGFDTVVRSLMRAGTGRLTALKLRATEGADTLAYAILPPSVAGSLRKASLRLFNALFVEIR